MRERWQMNANTLLYTIWCIANLLKNNPPRAWFFGGFVVYLSIKQQQMANVNDFIFEVQIIQPIKDIISKLENKQFRDCDMGWLNKKLVAYAQLALDAMGKKISLDDPLRDAPAIDGIINAGNSDRFLKNFKILLQFFEAID